MHQHHRKTAHRHLALRPSAHRHQLNRHVVHPSWAHRQLMHRYFVHQHSGNRHFVLRPTYAQRTLPHLSQTRPRPSPAALPRQHLGARQRPVPAQRVSSLARELDDALEGRGLHFGSYPLWPRAPCARHAPLANPAERRQLPPAGHQSWMHHARLRGVPCSRHSAARPPSPHDARQKLLLATESPKRRSQQREKSSQEQHSRE
mmetsp:Transcript_26315/g.55214  ORF Transcript_26315/g.55214 Transcript_26315/m.55214 type:complete len:203 (-) Transcript_26315:375-983(-)